MQLKRLHLQGFTSYIDSEITFNNNTVSTIVAPNGYGKSSILEAITTALFYKARGVDNKGAGMENLINNTCKEFIVTFEFNLNNVDYKIIRKKSKTKHELKLYINNIEQTEKISDTQAKINNIIKMDYETFLDTVCIGQGKSGNFMSKPANERKEVIANILSLNQYELYEKKAKEEKKLLNQKIQELQIKIDTLTQQTINEDNLLQTLTGYQQQDLTQDIQTAKQKYEDEKQKHIQYDTLKRQFEVITRTKNNINSNIQSQQNKLQNLKTSYKTQKTNLQDYQDRLLETQNNLITIIDIDIDINSLNAQQNNITNQINTINLHIAELSTTIKTNKATISDLKQQYTDLKQYDKGVCSFCGNNITSEHKQKHLTDLHSNAKKLSETNKQLQLQIDDYNTQINVLQNQLQDIQSQISTYNDLVNQRQQQKLKLQQQQNNIKLYENQINAINETLQNILTQKQEIESNLQSLQAELQQYDNIQDIKVQTFNDDILEQQYNDLIDKQQYINTQISIIQNQLNDINLAKTEINKLTNEINNLKIKITDYDSVIEAFGKKGIQADIIANVLPDIENEVNDILNVLFNNSLNIEFVTQKENSKGNTLETLEIIIHDKGADRKYETYSGGDKFRIDFAFHIGLSKFLSKRANNNIEFFMIDEGLGSQDDEGKDNFIVIINQIRKMFKQIFIITHIDEIKDVFDNKIIITKDPIKGSLIKKG